MTLLRPIPAKQTRRAALFLFLLAVYLLTYTPRINSSDGLAMFSTAENIIRRGALDVEQIRWMGLQQGTYGLDGLLYSRKGIGVPVGLLPLVWLGLTLPGIGPVGAGLLFNGIVTALTAVLVSAYLERLGCSPRTGLLAALVYGLGTLAWPYAKSLFSDPFSGLLLLAAGHTLLQFRQTGRVRYAFWAGLFLAWNVAARYAEAVFLPVFGLLLLYYGMRIYDLRLTIDDLRLTIDDWRLAIGDWRLTTKSPEGVGDSSFKIHNSKFTIAVLAFAAPVVLVGLALMGFNLSRYGDPLNTGYLPTETFSANWLQGILGQLVSPGRGLLLYSPVFLLSLAGLRPFARRHRAEAGLALSIILIHLLLYGKWFMWHGGFAWGPRFLVPTLPFWALLLAPVIEQTGANRGLRLGLAGLTAVSVAVQIPLLLVDFGEFQGWLLDTGLPMFHPQTFFDLRYAPLVQVWRFIRPDSLDLAWAWQGQVSLGVLAGLGVSLGVCGWWLAQGGKSLPQGGLALLTSLLAVSLLLAHVHHLPPLPLRQAVAALNQGIGPADAVILNQPEQTADFAELYRGRSPVLGLNVRGFPLPDDIQRRIAETADRHPQVWVLSPVLPPEADAPAQILSAGGFKARDETFAGLRLALYAFPADLPARDIGAAFGENIILTAAALPDEVQPGTALPVELHWQARQTPAEDYHVFIHLLTSQGERIAQSDGQPAQWTRPTHTWQPGETIVDRHGLWVPPDTPAGVYTLQIGLYRPETGERLVRQNGADAVQVRVRVGPAVYE